MASALADRDLKELCQGSTLQAAQLLRHFIWSLHTGAPFHPHFGDAVSLHRTLEAAVHSSATGHWEVVAQCPRSPRGHG